MTVRELIQNLLIEAPNLDAEVYIQRAEGEEEFHDFVVDKITNGGTNDAVFFEIHDYQPNVPDWHDELLPGDYDYFSGCDYSLGCIEELI